MRVLHITDSAFGGAGRGVIGLHEGLLDARVDSLVLTADPPFGPKQPEAVNVPIHHYVGSRVAMRGDKLLLRVLGGRTQETFHMPWLPTAIPRAIRDVNPDIVNLHWVGNMLTAAQVSRIALEYRTVWTMRDLAPVTGGCHYNHGCDRFAEHCGSCPMLSMKRARDPSFGTLKRKLGSIDPSGVYPVAISTWLASEINRSRLFRAREVDVIHPGIDTARYVPGDRRSAREHLSLPADDVLIGFVATHPFTDHRKGARVLDQALPLLPDLGAPVRVVATGTQAEARHFEFESDRWILIGSIREDSQISNLYAACDLVAVPSLQEAFGKVAAEAMACGVPVVAFRDTGVEDVVEHLKTGYLAEYGNSSDLANGIRWILEASRDANMTTTVRETAERRFSSQRQANQYIDVYRSFA